MEIVLSGRTQFNSRFLEPGYSLEIVHKDNLWSRYQMSENQYRSIFRWQSLEYAVFADNQSRAKAEMLRTPIS